MPRGLARAASLFGLVAAAAAGAVQVDTPAGVRVQLASDGRYAVSGGPAAWIFAGALGARPRAIQRAAGADALGSYQEIQFTVDAGPVAPFTGRLRAYADPAAVLFSARALAPAARAGPGLPRFTRLPPGLHCFSYREAAFAPFAFSAQPNGTPWLWFDDRGRAALLSPAANFLSAELTGDGVRTAAVGLAPTAANLPAGFTQQALLVFGPGINATWAAWGGALQRLAGRTAPAADADPGLRYLGYWTDNRAYYYYRYDTALGYAGTLEGLVRHFRAAAVPVRYLQLDSWWYYKSLTGPDGEALAPKNPGLPAEEWNRYGGLLSYRAHPGVFPHGLAAFQRAVNLPLITHNRWIDPANPDRARYRMSGYAAVDPAWWERTMGYLARAGACAYEQDWLNVIYAHSPAMRSTPGVGEAFTDAMAAAAAAHRLSIQYCMALPRFYLQGVKYDNLTTVRVSDDGFGPDRWDAFLYTSRLAGALGFWPWADVFQSTEPDNLLLANLSGGMVGFGDRQGAESRRNLLRAARPDGVLVKPDAPIYPTDGSFIADARGLRAPMVAWTYTANPHTAYVFAYGRAGAGAAAAFTPAELGFAQPVVVLDVRRGQAWRQPAAAPVPVRLGAGETRYYEVADAGSSGFAFFGDEGKLVSNGRGRIAAYRRAGDDIQVSLLFAQGEDAVRLFGFAPRPPRVRAKEGTVSPVLWDRETQEFDFSVLPAETAYWSSPSPNLSADPTQVAVIQISLP